MSESGSGFRATSNTTRGLRLRLGIHRGPAMAATLNDQLDYFGMSVRLAAQLAQLARGGDLLMTQEVAIDAQVAALLRDLHRTAEIVDFALPDQTTLPAHRITVVGD